MNHNVTQGAGPAGPHRPAGRRYRRRVQLRRDPGDHLAEHPVAFLTGTSARHRAGPRLRIPGPRCRTNQPLAGLGHAGRRAWVLPRFAALADGPPCSARPAAGSALLTEKLIIAGREPLAAWPGGGSARRSLRVRRPRACGRRGRRSSRTDRTAIPDASTGKCRAFSAAPNGGSARLPGAPCTVGDPTTAEHAAARPVCLCIASARSDRPLMPQTGRECLSQCWQSHMAFPRERHGQHFSQTASGKRALACCGQVAGRLPSRPSRPGSGQCGCDVGRVDLGQVPAHVGVVASPAGHDIGR